MSDWKLELSCELTLAHRLCTYTQYWVIKRSEGRKEAVRVLCALAKLGGDVLARCANGRTPLYNVVVLGHTKIVRLLGKMGGDVRAWGSKASSKKSCVPTRMQTANSDHQGIIGTLLTLCGEQSRLFSIKAPLGALVTTSR